MLKKNTVQAEVSALREKISALQNEQQVLLAQGRSRAEVKDSVESLVAEWAETGNKRRALDLTDLSTGENAKTLKVAGSSHATSDMGHGSVTVDLGPLLTTLLGADAIKAALLRGIEQVPAGLDKKAKASRLAAIANELDRLEHREERLIEQAEAAGEHITRRPDARPEVVLAPQDEGGDRGW